MSRSPFETRLAALALGPLLLFACGESSSTDAASHDDAGSTVADAAGGSAGGAAGPDAVVGGTGGQTATPDATRPDAGADALAVDAGPEDAAPPLPDAAPATCPPVDPNAPPAPAAGRWALSMFHFNVQYVAGGTEGFAETALRNPGAARLTDFSEVELEDRIIVESFEPMVDLLVAEPDFALTLELQGYMIDLIAERHPALLAKMQAVAAGGQLELASVHYSDQFFLAFGVDSIEQGLARTIASFAAADLPLSPVIFTQEGQFGPGFAAWLAAARPGAIMIMPRNLAGFFQQNLVDVPLFTSRGLDVVLPRGVSNEVVEKHFHFFDDGELLATGGLDPYFGELFVHRPASVAAYAHELRCLTERGVHVGRVQDYVSAVKAAGVVAQEMPPYLDGTWQPGSTRGALRWMGGGAGFRQHERDNQVLTTCIAAERAVRAAHVVAPAETDAAWRDLLLGQVSDARGLNPWRGEVQYGLRHCGDARDAANAVLNAEVTRRGSPFRVDLQLGVILEGGMRLPAQNPVDPPFEVRVEADPRPRTVTWTQPSNDEHLWQLEVEWAPAPEFVAARDDCLARGLPEHACDTAAIPLKLVFPRAPGTINVRPAFAPTMEQKTEADFQLAEDAFTDAVWLPAWDGWVDLGQGFHVIQDLGAVHLAYGFPAGEGRNAELFVLDETQPPHEPVTWRFFVTDDPAHAREIADRGLNPIVRVTGP